MSETEAQGRVARVDFTGTRSDLFSVLVRGHLLMLPTLGLYRFWMLTWKRRFYWQNTVIDGDALEYSGHAMQLLLGFLFAIGFFLPIYIVFFYLSTQAPEIAVLGYGTVAIVLWFLTGYAIYRARDFRLSRTLWRGIRFDQKGSAWGYAFRRFGWSILMLLSLGLVYPFMSGNLWRYRWRHTWYGDRQFAFTGSWRQLAGPYYLIYFGLVAFTFFVAAYAGSETDQLTLADGSQVPGPSVWLLFGVTALLLMLAYYYYRARETTRMFSRIAVGEAKVTVRVRARALFGQFLLYCLALTGALLAFLLVMGMLLGSVMLSAIGPDGVDPAAFARVFESSWTTIAAIIGAYLVLLAVFSVITETILGYGYWSLVARGASISSPDSLRSVRSAQEDRAVAGEGLADALNVGAY